MSVIRSEILTPSARLSMDERYRRSYTLEYLVTTNNPLDLQMTVLGGSLSSGPDPVPQIGDPFDPFTGSGEQDFGVWLLNKQVRRLSNDEGDRLRWVVTCTWGVPDSMAGGSTGTESEVLANPLLRPVVYSMEWADYTAPIVVDVVDNRQLVNSAGDLFNIERDYSRLVIVATKNEWPLESIIAKARQYQNTVNADTFFGFAPSVCRMDSITSGSLQFENGVEFYEVTYRIQVANPGEDWDLRLVNQGNMARYFTGNNPANPAEVKKRPVQVLEGGDPKAVGLKLDSAYLDHDGFQLSAVDEDGNPIPYIMWPAQDSDPYHIYRRETFADLGIGGDIDLGT